MPNSAMRRKSFTHAHVQSGQDRKRSICHLPTTDTQPTSLTTHRFCIARLVEIAMHMNAESGLPCSHPKLLAKHTGYTASPLTAITDGSTMPHWPCNMESPVSPPHALRWVSTTWYITPLRTVNMLHSLRYIKGSMPLDGYCNAPKKKEEKKKERRVLGTGSHLMRLTTPVQGLKKKSQPYNEQRWNKMMKGRWKSILEYLQVNKPG